jgi:hypothetical protein
MGRRDSRESPHRQWPHQFLNALRPQGASLYIVRARSMSGRGLRAQHASIIGLDWRFGDVNLVKPVPAADWFAMAND